MHSKSARVRRETSKLAVLAIILALLTALTSGCADGGYKSECLFYMGTAINIVAYADEATFSTLIQESKKILDYADKLDEDGAVARFNSAGYGEKTELDETVYSILLTVKEDPLTDGYNPLVAPLTDLWGFSPRFDENYLPSKPYDRARNEDGSLPLPDEKYILAFNALTDMDGLVLSEENGKYYCVKNVPPVNIDGNEYVARLDVGGCIKGYCADRIKDLYLSLGIKYGYVSFGTSSICLLLNKTGDWTVSLTSPDDEKQTYCKLKLPSGCASTSGDYENSYFLNGKRYCHIIGKDGYPVNNVRCVTVTGESALYCDMLSTALMTASLEDIGKRAAKVKEKSYDVTYCYGDNLTVESTAVVEISR